MPTDRKPSLPPGLTRLIALGAWPSAANWQQLHPIIPADRVRQFAEEEPLICLHPPPFRTVAEERDAGVSDFWNRFGALDQISPEQSLIIGDFGHGSDSAVILDFSRDASNPPVLRLRWTPDLKNEWVQGARDFDEFAEMLGLSERQDADSGA